MLKKITSIILVFVFLFQTSPLCLSQSSNWATSQMPDLESGVTFDFSNFDSDSQLPSQMSKFQTGGRIYFDSRLAIEAVGDEALSEAYIQTGEWESAQGSFTIEIEASASIQTEGNARIYLRDNLTKHAGCEIPLWVFGSRSVSFGGHKISFDSTQISTYRADINPQSGAILYYVDGTLVHSVESIYDISSAYADFNFGGFYLRIHSYTAENSAETNSINVKSICLGNNISRSSEISVLNRGVYLDADKLLIPQKGNNSFKWSVANGSSGDIEWYFAYSLNGKETIYEKFSLSAGCEMDYDFDVSLPCFNKGDELLVFFADAAQKPVTDKVSFISNGYSPPTKSQISTDSSKNAGVHPRIAGNSTAFQKALSIFEADSAISRAYSVGYDKTLADKLISKSASGSYYHIPCPYDDDDPLRLLAADTVLRYCKALSAEFLMSGDEAYKTRLWLELKNAAAYPDWNPQHFLDTAALCTAFAISYDWLYEYWSDDQLLFIKNALVNQGLSVYSRAYDGTLDSWAQWRYRRNNWNVVCNGGAIVGALSLIDDDIYGDMCSKIISRAMSSLSLALDSFAPDGAWYEGSGYWAYTMQYLTLVMSSLENMADTFYGIDRVDGISTTAMFPVYTTGEYEINLNDDGAEKYVSIPENFYLAKLFDTPSAAVYRMQQIMQNTNEAEFLDLLWYDDKYSDVNVSEHIKGITILGGSDLAVMRSSRSFAALHWGYNNISHGHLDCGTVFYDALGERWLEDAGSDDYNLYGYFNVSEDSYPKNRWGYYRTRAESHNTIVIGRSSELPDQIPDSGGKLLKSIEWDTGAFAVADMTECYVAASKVWRGVWVDFDTGSMSIVDEVELLPEHMGEEIYHIFHTKATVIPSTDKTVLYLLKETQGRLKAVSLKLQQADAHFEVVPDSAFEASPNPDLWSENITLGKTQRAISGSKIIICQPSSVGINSIQMTFSPLFHSKNNSVCPDLLPALSQW